MHIPFFFLKFWPLLVTLCLESYVTLCGVVLYYRYVISPLYIRYTYDYEVVLCVCHGHCMNVFLTSSIMCLSLVQSTNTVYGCVCVSPCLCPPPYCMNVFLTSNSMCLSLEQSTSTGLMSNSVTVHTPTPTPTYASPLPFPVSTPWFPWFPAFPLFP
jgi:hypothetical protein